MNWRRFGRLRDIALHFFQLVERRGEEQQGQRGLPGVQPPRRVGSERAFRDFDVQRPCKARIVLLEFRILTHDARVGKDVGGARVHGDAQTENGEQDSAQIILVEREGEDGDQPSRAHGGGVGDQRVHDDPGGAEDRHERKYCNEGERRRGIFRSGEHFCLC